jgi:antitoxin component YwqK of YwqJK toxin-antitoxin module
MKKTIILLTALSALLFLAFITPKNNIIGRWQIVVPDTSKLYVDFNRDGTFKNFLSNGTVIFEGKYKLSNDTFSIYDKGCAMDYPGKYKVTFSGENSIYFAVIEDSCKGRREDINGSTLKRVMKK